MKKVKTKIMAALAVMLCLSAGVALCGFTTADTASAQAAEVCVHEYKTEIVDATCSEMGYTLYTCEKCGDSYQDDFTDTKAHNLV